MAEECNICLQPFENGEMLKVLDCGQGETANVGPEAQHSQKHIFHRDCILSWFKKKSECPLCRSQFK